MSLKRAIYEKAGMRRLPAGGTFELSPLCNLSCAMCYVKRTVPEVRAAGGLLRPPQFLELAEEAKSAGVIYLLLTGGEPFLYEDFLTLYEKLYAMGFMLSINTNGTLIGSAEKRALIAHAPAHVNITLYGADNEAYERLCGIRNGFDKVKRTIDGLMEAGVTVQLNASITKYNVADHEAMHRFCSERKLTLNCATYMFPAIRRDMGNGENGARLSPEAAGIEHVKSKLFAAGEERFLGIAGECVSFYDKSRRAFAPEEGGSAVKCRAGRSSFWITWKGTMSPCGMLGDALSVPTDNGFLRAWEQTVNNTERIRYGGGCAGCEKKELCNPCMAMVYCETGGFDARPDYICKMNASMLKEYARAVEQKC